MVEIKSILKYYVVELQDDVIYSSNNRAYYKGDRLLVWEDKNNYIVANSGDSFRISCAKAIYVFERKEQNDSGDFVI